MRSLRLRTSALVMLVSYGSLIETLFAICRQHSYVGYFVKNHLDAASSLSSSSGCSTSSNSLSYSSPTPMVAVTPFLNIDYHGYFMHHSWISFMMGAALETSHDSDSCTGTEVTLYGAKYALPSAVYTPKLCCRSEDQDDIKTVRKGLLLPHLNRLEPVKLRRDGLNEFLRRKLGGSDKTSSRWVDVRLRKLEDDVTSESTFLFDHPSEIKPTVSEAIRERFEKSGVVAVKMRRDSEACLEVLKHAESDAPSESNDLIEALFKELSESSGREHLSPFEEMLSETDTKTAEATIYPGHIVVPVRGVYGGRLHKKTVGRKKTRIGLHLDDNPLLAQVKLDDSESDSAGLASADVDNGSKLLSSSLLPNSRFLRTFSRGRLDCTWLGSRGFSENIIDNLVKHPTCIEQLKSLSLTNFNATATVRTSDASTVTESDESKITSAQCQQLSLWLSSMLRAHYGEFFNCCVTGMFNSWVLLEKNPGDTLGFLNQSMTFHAVPPNDVSDGIQVCPAATEFHWSKTKSLIHMAYFDPEKLYGSIIFFKSTSVPHSGVWLHDEEELLDVGGNSSIKDRKSLERRYFAINLEKLREFIGTKMKS